ncbi:alpha/beta hydrolase-fold protein [Seonamhaeicola sp.]|uniref:alpha/beta hydrolase-fold protein n=1 Tax=Seonamhaeicola sp. TaxID=1912245 RepID=UPI00260B3CC6|nr:alpha/beta hydrolase-fold protein [Seonamhaeicola sp.]
MKQRATIFILILTSIGLQAQTIDTYFLHFPISKYDTIVYKRIIETLDKNNLIHVEDYYPNGQIQMDAYYSNFDKNVKEELQCNYGTNTKQGRYKEWAKNGQLIYDANYKNGLRDGLAVSWYENGIKESEKKWNNGQLNGTCKYWNEKGDLEYDLTFKNGINQSPETVSYQYITYLPTSYASNALKEYPLLIFLHGGSARGTDTLDLYDAGPFDQIYRGRNFPFIIVAPQCPKNIRWSTENWFENFYSDLIKEYRIDTNKVYLTGESLGGSGTWYIATKYSDKFTAIAPMSGFTRHMDYISENIENLKKMPIWAFHGELDNVVPVEETDYLINRLNDINSQVKYTRKKSVGHWIHWLVYPENELYDWFMSYDKRNNK